jgi:hypothetical protein
MQLLTLWYLLTTLAVSTARSPQHVGKKLPERRLRSVPMESPPTEQKFERRQSSRYMTDQTSSEYCYMVHATIRPYADADTGFSVNGTDLPDVDFDIGVRWTSQSVRTTTDRLRNHMLVFCQSRTIPILPNCTSGSSHLKIPRQRMRLPSG